MQRRTWMCGTPGCHNKHNSSGDSFDCHANHLVKIGFKKLSSREYENPDTGAVRILTKRSRFGAFSPPGKRGEAGDQTPTKGGRPGLRRAKRKRSDAILSL